MAILDAIIQQLESDLATALAASERAHQTATDKENIPENKYDTLALEAAYLAHGQSKRIEELHKSLLCYQKLSLPTFTNQTPIQLGALVTLEDVYGTEQCLFLGPDAGGLQLEHLQQKVMVVTPKTPMGKALVGCLIGDEISMVLANETKRYFVIDVA